MRIFVEKDYIKSIPEIHTRNQVTKIDISGTTPLLERVNPSKKLQSQPP